MAWYTCGLAHRLLVAFLWTALAVRRVPLSRMVPAKYSTIVSIFFTDGHDLLYRATRTCSTRGPLFNGRRISRGGEGTLNSRAG